MCGSGDVLSFPAKAVSSSHCAMLVVIGVRLVLSDRWLKPCALLLLFGLLVGCTPEVRLGALDPDYEVTGVNSEASVYFPTGSWNVDSSALSALRQIANEVEMSTTAIVEINGFADERGDLEFNRRLSQRRAEAVALVLSDQFGVDPRRMRIVGQGEVATGQSDSLASELAKNRRVDVSLVGERGSQTGQASVVTEQPNLTQSDLAQFRSRQAEAIEQTAARPSPKPTPAPCTDDASCERRGTGISTGTGFYISTNFILTNQHVIADSRELFVVRNDELYQAVIVAESVEHDLALLDVAISGTPLALASSLPRKGEEIGVLGFPSIGLLGNELKATFGNINALSGLQGDESLLQIDAAIQPGNSGSPVVTMNGDVVGVATASLNQEVAMQELGVLAQSVNYAVKIGKSEPLSTRIIYGSSTSADLGSADLVELVEPSVVLILNYFEPGSEIQESRKQVAAEIEQKPGQGASGGNQGGSTSQGHGSPSDSEGTAGGTNSSNSSGPVEANKNQEAGSSSAPFHFIHVEKP